MEKTIKTISILKPSEGHWLYKDETTEEGLINRNFVREVINADENEWQECTNEEKEKYEEIENIKRQEATKKLEEERNSNDNIINASDAIK